MESKELTQDALEARREYQRAYRAKNRDRVNQYTREWKAAHKDRVREQNRKYWEHRAARLKAEAENASTEQAQSDAG